MSGVRWGCAAGDGTSSLANADATPVILAPIPGPPH